MDLERTEIDQASRNGNTELLRKLSGIVNSQTAIFACGGSVEATTTAGAPGVTIRCDNDKNKAPHKVSFPCSGNTAQGFEALVRACEPATFGLENRDVLDEGYRKASKLDNTAFSTNFHPHDFGIVDAVQQTLMPIGMGEAREKNTESYGIRAERGFGFA